jgi:hypothetical protein
VNRNRRVPAAFATEQENTAMPDHDAGSHRFASSWFRPAYVIPIMVALLALLWFRG